jgi:predicted small lipoprotein YifL
MVRAIAVTLGCLLLLSGCGIKGPLRPPPPAAPADAAAQGSPGATPGTADTPAGAKKP